MQFRYRFERADGSRSGASLEVDAGEAVAATVAVLDKAHAGHAPQHAAVSEDVGSSGCVVVSFEVGNAVSLDEMRTVLGHACAMRGVVCLDLIVAPNPMVGQPGGDAG
jgi:hypothetical protein